MRVQRRPLVAGWCPLVAGWVPPVAGWVPLVARWVPPVAGWVPPVAGWVPVAHGGHPRSQAGYSRLQVSRARGERGGAHPLLGQRLGLEAPSWQCHCHHLACWGWLYSLLAALRTPEERFPPLTDPSGAACGAAVSLSPKAAVFRAFRAAGRVPLGHHPAERDQGKSRSSSSSRSA